MPFFPASAPSSLLVNATEHGVSPSASGAQNTAALNALLSALSASGGGYIDFPSGIFTFAAGVTLRGGVFLRGTHRSLGSSVLSGTRFECAGNAILLDPSEPGCGLIGIDFDGGSNQIYAPNGCSDFHVQDCSFNNPTQTCWSLGSICQFCYFKGVLFHGGQYAITLSNPNPVSTPSSFQSVRFENIHMSAWTVRACDFTFGQGTNNVTWLNVVSQFALPAAGEAGGIMTLRDQLPTQWTFLNWNAEGIYSGAADGTTRCTGTAGQNTVTCTALSGTQADGTAAWAVGRTVTIQAAAVDGSDWSSTITAISGTTLTLAGVLPTSVAGQEICPYAGIDFDFQAGCHGAHFIDCQFGTSGGGLYALRTTGPGPCYVDGSSSSQVRPIYDPWGQVVTHNRSWLVRRAASTPNSGIGDLPLCSTYFEAASSVQAGNPPLGGNQPRRTQIAAPSGADLRLAFTETNHDGTGTYGRLRVSKYNAATTDAADTLLFDPQTGTCTLPTGPLQIGAGTYNAAYALDLPTGVARVSDLGIGQGGPLIQHTGANARQLSFGGPTGQATQLSSSDGIGFVVGGAGGTALSYLDASNVLHVGSGLACAQATKTSSYTLSATDSTICVNAASLTMTLPDATTCAGRLYTIKNDASGASTTVATTASQTIDGASTKTLAAAWNGLTVQSNGANWRVLTTV